MPLFSKSKKKPNKAEKVQMARAQIEARARLAQHYNREAELERALGRQTVATLDQIIEPEIRARIPYLLSLPPNVLRRVSMSLPYAEVLKVCRAAERIDQEVCLDKQYWVNRFQHLFAPPNAPPTWAQNVFIYALIIDLWKAERMRLRPHMMSYADIYVSLMRNGLLMAFVDESSTKFRATDNMNDGMLRDILKMYWPVLRFPHSAGRPYIGRLKDVASLENRQKTNTKSFFEYDSSPIRREYERGVHVIFATLHFHERL